MNKSNAIITADQHLNPAAMQRDQLWLQLKQKNLTQQEECPDDPFLTDDNDWMVRILQGVGGWFAALFLLVSMAALMTPIIEFPWLCGLLGLVMNFAAFHYYWQHKRTQGSPFLRQLFLVLSLAGQFLVSYAIIDFLGFQHSGLFLVLALYQAFLVAVMHDFVHRLMSALFAVTLIFWGHSELLVTGVGSALLAIAVVWLWFDKVGWYADKVLYEPLAYAAALTLVGLNIQALNWYWQIGRSNDDSVLLYGDMISGCLHLLAFAFLYQRLHHNNMLPDIPRDRYLLISAVLCLAILGFVIPGLSGAVLLLMVGFAVRQRPLMGLGILSIVGFVSWYYYQLNITLLTKSMLLGGLGVVLLLVAWYGRQSAQVNPVQPVKAGQGYLAVLTITVLGTLAVVNAGIIQKQRLINHGTLVFLKLAPVDPRSLMQGDYMRLRFAVTNQAQAAHPSEQLDSIPQRPKQGIVSLDAQNVGHWSDFYHGQTLKDNQYLMDLQWQGQRVHLVTDAYFFEEGTAETFEQADYGGFRVNQSGDYVLVGLYDDQFKQLVHSPAVSDN